MFLAGERCSPLQDKVINYANTQRKDILFIPSAHKLHPRPPHFYMRACKQCVHESARLSRVICSHAWYSRDCGERETADFIICPVPHALATHGLRD